MTWLRVLRERRVSEGRSLRGAEVDSVDDAAEKLQYDLYYVKNHSLILDTLVLFETVRVVLTGEGAH